ncbi:MAG: choice-of-anchor V domain-containing protein [Candidatus Binatia bacterium]
MSSSARRVLCVLTLPLLVAAPAAARQGGIVDYSDIGCTDCHDVTGIPTPTVEIIAPAMVQANTEVTVQVVVTRPADTQLGAGFNFAAAAGDVRVGTDRGVRRAENRRLKRFELTHAGPRDYDANGQASWSFVWLTPSAPGDYALTAAGNSVNLDNDSTGDASAFTMLTVRVVGADATPTPTVTPAPACAGDCNGDGAVAINELISGVNIALGTAPVGTCASIDANGDGRVAINELVAAVSRALGGC